jgi:hypothetical protein
MEWAKVSEVVGAPGWARTSDFLINSQALYQLSYRGIVWIITQLPRSRGGLTTKCYQNATSRVSVVCLRPSKRHLSFV